MIKTSWWQRINCTPKTAIVWVCRYSSWIEVRTDLRTNWLQFFARQAFRFNEKLNTAVMAPFYWSLGVISVDNMLIEHKPPLYLYSCQKSEILCLCAKMQLQRRPPAPYARRSFCATRKWNNHEMSFISDGIPTAINVWLWHSPTNHCCSNARPLSSWLMEIDPDWTEVEVSIMHIMSEFWKQHSLFLDLHRLHLCDQPLLGKMRKGEVDATESIPWSIISEAKLKKFGAKC